MVMKIIAQRLAEYSHNLKYEDLPHVVVHEAKRRVIDSIGCAIGAFGSEPSRIARKIATDLNQHPSRPSKKRGS